ncbi:FAD-binding oxidoreductase [Roseococcus sp. YIM B11640]|uniref:FAD-binding oxidoreductase n=1 Tax=Roseococcus sp. YIM B11640 TaxID=3133973 RepID=UPI003C7C971E
MTAIASRGYLSWGRNLRAEHWVERPSTPAAAARLAAAPMAGRTRLGVGCGRSYGDAGLNPDGELIEMRPLDRFISFDRETGILEAEAGLRLADILAVLARPEADGAGWFLPVTPGTRYVTLGGAVANDVHGKNHHRAGSFGRHVLGFDLARSDGRALACSPSQNAELFAATIGGLGLTGLLLRVRLQLLRVPGLAMEAEDLRFGGLDEYFAIAAQSDEEWDYTAAWVDCLADGDAMGRGIFSRARPAPGQGALPPSLEPRRNLPATPPLSAVNSLSLRAFNALYLRRLGSSGRSHRVGGYEGVLYPLDAVGGWNKLYGPRGFHQFQCAVPPSDARDVVAALLREISRSGQGSPLVVLKGFGNLPSPGLLSFPMPGTTLALDFPARGDETLRLLSRLEAITVEAQGRLYPAKDSVMSADTFQRGYTKLDIFRPWIDPAFASGFSRRVGLTP